MDEALTWLRCLETGSKLIIATPELLNLLNDQIANGSISNRLGQSIASPVTAGLVNESKTILYLVNNGIPQMVADEAISLKQLSNLGE